MMSGCSLLLKLKKDPRLAFRIISSTMEVLSWTESENNISMKIKANDFTPIHKMRQKIMREVTTLAVDEVMIFANTTVIFDEMLAHRLTMIPFLSPDGVDSDILELETSQAGYVMSKSLFGETRPAVNDIVIAKLCPGERLKVVIRLKRGSGKLNAKWNPIVTFGYKPAEPGTFDVTMETTGALSYEQIQRAVMN